MNNKYLADNTHALAKKTSDKNEQAWILTCFVSNEWLGIQIGTEKGQRKFWEQCISMIC